MEPISIKSVDEGRAKFREHKQALIEKGVHLPYQMQRYLTDREKKSGVMAFDSSMLYSAMGLDAVTSPIAAQGALPGPLSSDPNAALPWLLTSAIDPEIIRVIFSPLDFPQILSERKAGDWTEQTRFFPLVEATGEVSTYDDFVNNGRAGANFNYPQLQSYLFQTILNYGELQIARAGLAKINWVSELGIAAADLLNRYQNLSYAFGISGLQNYGVINNPFISASLTPATKAWGGTGWFNAGAPAATANEVYNDIVAMVVQLVAQTNGAVDIKAPMVLAMSPNSEIATTFANSFGVDVMALLKKNYPNLAIETAPQYGLQTVNNPQGYSAAGNVLQLFPRRIQGQTVVYCAYNEKLRAHKIIPDLSSWKQKQTSGTWGTVIRMPVAFVTMIGV
jgi:hypothetical protein